MRTNVALRQPILRTHEGGPAARTPALEELTRAVSTCLLWENGFYEGGDSIAQRVADLCDRVDLEDIGALAVTARYDLKLRHVPLWLCIQLVRINSTRKTGSDVPSQTIFAVINRPDELTELLALYWREGKRPLAKQLKKGLALALTKFEGEHTLSKWNRDSAVRLRDLLFLVHASPEPGTGIGCFTSPISKPGYQRGATYRNKDGQGVLWAKLVVGTLETPETWEVLLSSGEDKKATWEYLMLEKKLGIIAALMNCRAMLEAGVDRGLIRQYLLEKAPGSWALPFRFISAAKHAPALASDLSDAMLLAIQGRQHLSGETAVVVDVSGSMDAPIAAKSTLTRIEAAGSLAVLIREICDNSRVFTFSNELVEVDNYRGLPLIRVIHLSQQHGGTYLRGALEAVKSVCPQAERVVVITDEQSHDGNLPAWTKYAYLMNVAGSQPALSLAGGWKRVNGFSERLVDWIVYEELGSLRGAEGEE